MSHFLFFYCDTKLILYREALNNASQMSMRYHLLATLVYKQGHFCTETHNFDGGKLYFLFLKFLGVLESTRYLAMSVLTLIMAFMATVFIAT